MHPDVEATRETVLTQTQPGLLAQSAAWTNRALVSGFIAPMVVAAYVVIAPVIGPFVEFEVFNG